MDQTLRILKRLSLSGDPEAKERYIAALERLTGGELATKPLTDLCVDLHGMVGSLAEVLRIEGTHIMLWQHEGGSNAVYFLVEEETPVSASGLCLAATTRQATSAMLRHYGEDGFKTWSADPLIFLEDWDIIFSWSIER